MSKDYDVAVVGGGLLGSAIAWGLGRLRKKVVVLDEGDIAKRASRANFALVWVQSKGLGMPAYTGWTVRASEMWGKLADGPVTEPPREELPYEEKDALWRAIRRLPPRQREWARQPRPAKNRCGGKSRSRNMRRAYRSWREQNLGRPSY